MRERVPAIAGDRGGNCRGGGQQCGSSGRSSGRGDRTRRRGRGLPIARRGPGARVRKSRSSRFALSHCSRPRKIMPASHAHAGRSAESRTCAGLTRGSAADAAEEKVLRHSRLAGASAYGAAPPGIRARIRPLPLLSEPSGCSTNTKDMFMPDSLLHRSLLLAMLDRFDEPPPRASKGRGRARALQREQPGAVSRADRDARRRSRRRGRGAGKVIFSSVTEIAPPLDGGPLLGRSLCALGRQKAEPFAQLGLELGTDDIVTQALWRQLESVVLTSRGESVAAQSLEREAVELTDRTDCLNLQGDALCEFAEGVAAAGATRRTRAALEQALDRYEPRRISQCSRRLTEARGPAREESDLRAKGGLFRAIVMYGAFETQVQDISLTPSTRGDRCAGRRRTCGERLERPVAVQGDGVKRDRAAHGSRVHRRRPGTRGRREDDEARRPRCCHRSW